MIDVPMRLEDITAEWLTAALREGGLDVAPVASLEEDVIGDVAGMTGAIARLRITYEDGPGLAGPSTLIAKCPLDDDLNRMINSFTRMYERESTFYKHFADDGAVRAPRCYYNGHQADVDQHMVLLEDMADARPGDNNIGLSPADAEVAIDALASLHGRYWNRVDPAAPVMGFDNELFRQGIPIMQDAWQQLLDARPGLVPDDLIAAVDEWYVADWDRWLAVEQQSDHTLVHGDFRADNMLFGDDGVAVIDWQMLCRTSPGMDLVWLLGTSFADEVIEEIEDDLLARWARGVAAAGGPELDDAEVRRHLRLFGFFWITSVAHVFTREFDDPHLLTLQTTLAERMIRACIRWDLAGHGPE